MRKEMQIFFTALMFYTRIPCPGWVKHDPDYLNQATKYLPLIGWIVGGSAALAFYLSATLFPKSIAIIASIAASIFITGGFHEDGLADVGDGFGGGWTRKKILEIMKDSRIGTFGALAIGLALALKFFSLMEIPSYYIPIVLIIGHSMSRTASVVVVYFYEYARSNESSKSKPVAKGTGKIALIIALVVGLLPLSLLKTPLALTICIPPLIVMIGMAHYFNRWIGGYTGDCLGAIQQISELSIYMYFLVIWRFI